MEDRIRRTEARAGAEAELAGDDAGDDDLSSEFDDAERTGR